jgi:hypothetical protein
MRRYQHATSHLVGNQTQGARLLVKEHGQTLALGLEQVALGPVIAATELRVAGQLAADQAQQVELNEPAADQESGLDLAETG